MLKKITLGLAVGFGTLAASTPTFAQTSTDVMASPDNSAYLQDARGVIARSGHGLCWRTGYWTPASAVRGCDGELTPPIAKPTAPDIVPPAPIAQAPVPVAPAAPKRCDFSVTLKSDETFTFNRAILNDAARKRIDSDVLAHLPNCRKIDLVMVTGHTDRLGSHPYNQKLSEKRADAVTSYLASKGVTANMDTLGAGKTQPVQACDDKLTRAPLISCLAPNRRVTIEIRGLAR